MSDSKGLIDYLLRHGKSEKETWEGLAIRYGFKGESGAREAWKRYKTSQEGEISSASFEDRGEEGILTYSGRKEIKTKEDLIRECNIDIGVWNIDRLVHNAWGKGGKQNFQVKAWLSKKKEEEIDRLEKLLSNYNTPYTPLEKRDIIINDVFPNPVSLFISLADPHIDKRTLDKSTIEEKMHIYLTTLDKLLFRAYRSHNIDEIVYVLGNDYFTSDNYTPSTTAGTPQNVTDHYDDSYEKGFELAVTCINKLKQFCNTLKVVFVPANHDRTKSFFLLHALSVYFSSDKNIIFDRGGENTKVHVYGNTFIGMHHGDTIMEKLPLYFASKYREEWGKCKYSEIALADKHHKKQWKFNLSEEEVNGVRMFISPALTSPDVWHKDKCYDLSILAGVIRIYDKTKGYIGELEERI